MVRKDILLRLIRNKKEALETKNHKDQTFGQRMILIGIAMAGIIGATICTESHI